MRRGVGQGSLVCEVGSCDVGLKKRPVNPRVSDLLAQHPKKQHPFLGESQPREDYHNKGNEDKFDPIQKGLHCRLKITHLLPKAKQVLDVIGDVLDMVEQLDGMGRLKAHGILRNQLHVLDRVGIIDMNQIMAGHDLASLGVAIVEVKEPAIWLNKGTLSEGGVTDTAGERGFFVFFVVQHGRGVINTGSFLSLPILHITTTTRRLHMIFVSLRFHLTVVSLCSL